LQWEAIHGPEDVKEVILDVREVILDVREVILDVREVILDVREVIWMLRRLYWDVKEVILILIDFTALFGHQIGWFFPLGRVWQYPGHINEDIL
jgi:hypothetical protein